MKKKTDQHLVVLSDCSSASRVAKIRLCKALCLFGAVAMLGACASPTVVETRKMGDATLTCDKIKAEFEEAEQFEKAARKERTATGTNVAAAIFFWPALIGTYSNTEQAINAARERKENLHKLAESKKCEL
jgi:hypothetical protein